MPILGTRWRKLQTRLGQTAIQSARLTPSGDGPSHPHLITFGVRGIQGFPVRDDDSFCRQIATACIERAEIHMHDLLIALALVGMLIAPAIVAARVEPSEGLE